MTGREFHHEFFVSRLDTSIAIVHRRRRLLLPESPRLRIWCRVPDYFVAAIDLRKSLTLYEKNASPMPPTIAKLRHTASSPPPR